MQTATTRQIDLIRRLLSEREHTDTGRTIQIGQTRVRTTADRIDSISRAQASRLITALLDAPLSSGESPEPSFTRHMGHWAIRDGDAGWQPGDEVGIMTRAGRVRWVELDGYLEDDQLWTFVSPCPPEPHWSSDRGTPTARDTDRPATRRQVDYIWQQVQADAHEGCWMQVPTRLADIQALTVSQASDIIDALIECR